MLKEKFVCVTLDARKERGEYKDADGDFVRATNCVTVTAAGSVCVVTAGGKALGPYAGSPSPKWLETKLKAWEALPETDRVPGAVKVPASETVDPKRAALKLPSGALVLRVFNRRMGRDEKEELRYVLPEDFVGKMSKAEVDRHAMAQNDFMWIPQKEWQALVPAQAERGKSYEAPVSFTLRLFRFHLDPARGFTEGAYFTRSKSEAGRLTLTVQEATAAKLTLRLEGSAKLQQPGRDAPAIYAPAILGYLEYDREKKCFTRFDMVAVGIASGAPADANGKVHQPLPYPLGIAFEMVVNPTPADRLHPRGARDNVAAYLEPKDK